MIDTDEKKYVASLAQNIWGVAPKDVVASQLNIVGVQTIVKRFFVLAYNSEANSYLSFFIGNTTTDTMIGDVSGVDGLNYLLVDKIVSTGNAVVTGYEFIY